MTRTTAREVEPDLLERLRQAATDLHDASKAMRDRMTIRDRLIVEAVDAGIAQRTIVRAAGVSKGRVIQVTARHG